MTGQQYELLTTKLVPPRLHSRRVSRAPLLARLDDGRDYKLTLISAPAGFGKTTLVSEWIVARALSAGWLSLDAGDNDPVRFWRYVITACQSFAPDIGRSALTILEAPPRALDSLLTAALTEFINELAQLGARRILVLEDYHLITAQSIHTSLAFFLEHLPETLHLVIMTRNEPPLPLARLRARNELYELEAADLRFSLADSQDFLCQTVPYSLSAEAMNRLSERTEGWVAGLRLAALALQGRTGADVEQYVAAFNGSHRHVVEYLASEALASQPPDIQEFLLQTAFLSRLSASLSASLTNRDDSGLILEQLEKANLFLVRLDNDWYRYHPLFAEAMHHYARRHLGETRLRDLYQAASVWYEKHDLWGEAVETCFLAQDLARAANLIERAVEKNYLNSELHTLHRWVEKLPEDVLRPHPMLCLGYATAILFTDDRNAPETMTRLEKPLHMAENYWRGEGNMSRVGRVLALRSLAAWWQENLALAFSAAHQAAELLPEDEPFWRSIPIISLGMEELLAGQTAAAREAALNAIAFCEVNNEHGKRAAISILSDVYACRGELREAARYAWQVLNDSEDDPSDKTFTLMKLGALAYERNDLEAAEQYAGRSIALSEQIRETYPRFQGQILLAKIKYARGQTAQADQMLRSTIAQLQMRSWPLLLREALNLQAVLALKSANLQVTQRWSAAQDLPHLIQEREALTAARLLIARNETGAALRLLGQWQIEASSGERKRSEIEILMLKALAFFREENVSQASDLLVHALRLAQPEGFQRLFLDEGEAMARLLEIVIRQTHVSSIRDYARALLDAFAYELSPNVSPMPTIQADEPLSPQEQRVLRLLAVGLSNPEIAGELVVSINTVKTQVKSIYRKLNVTSREQAGDVARSMNLT